MDPFVAFQIAFVFVIGAVIGSFLNVCIYRFPQHIRVTPAWQALLHPPSHCPRCKAAIRWHDNVPVFGWLWLRGRCRDCGLWIPIRYPAIELLTGLVFVALYLAELPFGPVSDSSTYHPYGPLAAWNHGLVRWPGIPGVISQLQQPSYWSFSAVLWIRYAFHATLLVALITATFIDYDLMIIPDAVTRPATIAGILGNTLFGVTHLVPVWYGVPGGLTFSNVWFLFSGRFQPPGWIPPWLWTAMTAVEPPAWTVAHPHLHGLAVSAAGIVVGAFVIWMVRVVGHWALGREAMGDGDIYLLAMIGAFLGWQATIVVFFLAPLCALAAAVLMLPFKRAREIPYGPYLSIAALLVMLFFQRLWPPFESGLFSLGPIVPVVLLAMGPTLGGLLRISRIVMLRLGFRDEMILPGEWGPGDQLAYLAMERVDEQKNTWRTDNWPGVGSGRGQSQQQTWQRGVSGQAWKQGWERRGS